MTIGNWYRDMYEKSKRENKELKEKLEQIYGMVEGCMVCQSKDCANCDLIRRIKNLAKP